MTDDVTREQLDADAQTTLRQLVENAVASFYLQNYDLALSRLRAAIAVVERVQKRRS